MKLLLRLSLGLFLLILAVIAAAWIDGAMLPETHTATVTGTINASPDAVFAKIADVPNQASFRPQVKSVQLLDATPGHERWVEDLGHGQTMQFQAVTSSAPALRAVKLDDPHAAYGGTWTYQLRPGPAAGTTTLAITENGFIHPPLYRFLMQHVIGMTANLNTYLKNMQDAFTH